MPGIVVMGELILSSKADICSSTSVTYFSIKLICSINNLNCREKLSKQNLIPKDFLAAEEISLILSIANFFIVISDKTFCNCSEEIFSKSSGVLKWSKIYLDVCPKILEKID